jgi:hypothetical protein
VLAAARAGDRHNSAAHHEHVDRTHRHPDDDGPEHPFHDYADDVRPG